MVLFWQIWVDSFRSVYVSKCTERLKVKKTLVIYICKPCYRSRWCNKTARAERKNLTAVGNSQRSSSTDHDRHLHVSCRWNLHIPVWCIHVFMCVFVCGCVRAVLGGWLRASPALTPQLTPLHSLRIHLETAKPILNACCVSSIVSSKCLFKQWDVFVDEMMGCGVQWLMCHVSSLG